MALSNRLPDPIHDITLSILRRTIPTTFAEMSKESAGSCVLRRTTNPCCACGRRKMDGNEDLKSIVIISFPTYIPRSTGAALLSTATSNCLCTWDGRGNYAGRCSHQHRYDQRQRRNDRASADVLSFWKRHFYCPFFLQKSADQFYGLDGKA